MDKSEGPAHLKKVLTLVYLLDGEKILLGLKKRGFGEGKVGYILRQYFAIQAPK